MNQNHPVRQAERYLQSGRKEEARSLLEQVLAQDSSATDALHHLARIAASDRDFARATEFLNRLAVLHPDRGEYPFELGMIELERQHFDRALEHLDKAAAMDPDHPAVLLHRGFALECVGRTYDAAMAYNRAWVKALDGGRLAGRLPPALQKLAAHGRQVMQLESRRLFDEILARVRESFDGADMKRLEQLVAIVTGVQPPPPRYPLQSSAGVHFPGLPEKHFFERELFPWIENVEAQTERIRDEYLALGEDDAFFKPYVSLNENSPFKEHWKNVNNSRAWNSCHIYNYGTLREEVARRCPVTLETIGRTPLIHVKDHGPESIFSVLKPKTHIPPHHGLVGGRLLVHLPLIVPKNCGALRVGGEQRVWEVGRCLVFDDTYAHEAWNNSDETRVVLIFDVWSPYLSEAERAGFGAIVEALDKINLDSLDQQVLRE